MIGDAKPFVILVVGVNGSGKTTPIGKLAAKFAAEGSKVVLAAGDTFRAAAIDQLKIWGTRTGAQVRRQRAGRRRREPCVRCPVSQAKREGADVVIIDTAGRLQNRAELMERAGEDRPRDEKGRRRPRRTPCCWCSTPPSARTRCRRSRCSSKIAGVTGLVMTKLDGTARGGILVAIAQKFGLPIHFIGVGEGVDDLAPSPRRISARPSRESSERWTPHPHAA